MNAIPLLFLGDKRREALATRLASAARRWRQHWVPGAADIFEATCEAPAADGFASPVAAVAISCWALEIAGERVAVLLLPHGTFAWCVLEPGAQALDLGGAFAADSLAEKLEHEVAHTLLAQACLRDAREVAGVSRLSATELPDWSRAARAWTLNLRTPGCARGCVLLVAAARLDLLAPARALPRGADALGARRDAVGENVVALRAVVGETSMSVSELAELALDDVLVLDQHLTEPVTLMAPATGAAVVAGSLGRAGARRAIKVAGIPAHKN